MWPWGRGPHGGRRTGGGCCWTVTPACCGPRHHGAVAGHRSCCRCGGDRDPHACSQLLQTHTGQQVSPAHARQRACSSTHHTHEANTQHTYTVRPKCDLSEYTPSYYLEPNKFPTNAPSSLARAASASTCCFCCSTDAAISSWWCWCMSWAWASCTWLCSSYTCVHTHKGHTWMHSTRHDDALGLPRRVPQSNPCKHHALVLGHC